MQAVCAQREARLRAARNWATVKTFCEQHGLPQDASRLVHLAAADDWVHFLAEASSQGYTYDQVCNTGSPYFLCQDVLCLSFAMWQLPAEVCLWETLPSKLVDSMIMLMLAAGCGCGSPAL